MPDTSQRLRLFLNMSYMPLVGHCAVLAFNGVQEHSYPGSVRVPATTGTCGDLKRLWVV